MCYGRWQEVGAPPIINDSVKDAAEKIKVVYDIHEAGGRLHAVLDDWNIEDEDISFTWNYLADPINRVDSNQHETEIACLRAFEILTLDERYSALALFNEFITEEP